MFDSVCEPSGSTIAGLVLYCTVRLPSIVTPSRLASGWLVSGSSQRTLMCGEAFWYSASSVASSRRSAVFEPGRKNPVMVTSDPSCCTTARDFGESV